jgi:hypothetical protein
MHTRGGEAKMIRPEPDEESELGEELDRIYNLPDAKLAEEFAVFDIDPSVCGMSEAIIELAKEHLRHIKSDN